MSPEVLLVDDEAEFTGTLGKILGRRGYRVTLASDGEEALAAAGGRAFDAVVLDVKMHGMDGIQVLAQLRRTAPATSVILLTGHLSAAQQDDGLRAGAFAYLLKPVAVAELVAAIEEAVRATRAARGPRGG